MTVPYYSNFTAVPVWVEGIDAARHHVLIHRTAATKATMATATKTTTKVVAKAAMRWRG